jgi:glycosyltransferase involved in cell wall biosynthesis
MSEPHVSIVTPVHNGADYLPECIESVLAQTYKNWDYTVVDNCSTDESTAIARRYAAKDARIRLYENRQLLPAIANHNVALRQIAPGSKYCKVVFADDWIFPECLQRMVDVAERHPTVVLVGAYCLEGDHVICTGLPYSREHVPGRQIGRQHLLNGQYLFGSANSLLYRADVVRGREQFFNEANIHADTEASFELLKNADFGFVHQVLTYTRVRPLSLTSMSNDLQTNLAGELRILNAHGSYYLEPDELAARIDRHLEDYYLYLGKSILLRRDQDFWKYHTQQLADLGVRFSRARLVKATIASMCSPASLKYVMGKVWRRRSRQLHELNSEPVRSHAATRSDLKREQ